jgi:hypothetical protein
MALDMVINRNEPPNEGNSEERTSRESLRQSNVTANQITEYFSLSKKK